MSGSHRAAPHDEELEMSTTTKIPTTQTSTSSAPTMAVDREPVWKHGVAAAVVASVATTVLAAVASAAGSPSPTAPARASRSPGSRS